MKDYIKALKEVEKESDDFELSLSKKEIVEIANEFDRLNTIINNIADYVNKMGFGSIVDNPRQDLVRILDKEK